MAEHTCGVAGCSEEARWIRVSKADADLHEFLCPEHWHQLHSCSLVAAAAYLPLGDPRAAHARPSEQGDRF